jgi:predicted O-methyltransferase YrrM
MIARAGLADRVEIRLGPALESLATLADEVPFDLVFIDANKDSVSSLPGLGVTLGTARRADRGR